jgi:hypothetical protein
MWHVSPHYARKTFISAWCAAFWAIWKQQACAFCADLAGVPARYRDHRRNLAVLVDWREIKVHLKTCRSSATGPPISRPINILAAHRPWWVASTRTVASGGAIKLTKGSSSKPITDISRGTERPRLASAPITPSTIVLFPAEIVVRSGLCPINASVARLPLSALKSSATMASAPMSVP